MGTNEIKEKLEEWKKLQVEIKDVFSKLYEFDELDEHSRNIVDAYIAIKNICTYEINKYTNLLSE